MSRVDYIKRIAPIAQESCKNTGLFPSLMIAQAILESADGRSILAARYNNHFGIKADRAWKGKTVSMKTREVFNGHSTFIKDGFRVYETLQDGFKDRNTFLRINPRYTTHGVFAAKTPEEQAEAFQRAGYATDPNYARLLTQVINGSANLKQYDR